MLRKKAKKKPVYDYGDKTPENQKWRKIMDMIGNHDGNGLEDVGRKKCEDTGIKCHEFMIGGTPFLIVKHSDLIKKLK